MTTAPIVLFTYARLSHTRQTVDALLKNDLSSQSDLIVFSDAARNEAAEPKVAEVRDYLKAISGFKTVRVIERERNFGLGKNIIEGVTQVINDCGKAIILEDDLVTSRGFLRFMNDALEKYKDEDRVISIVGYVYPVDQTLPSTFFIRGSDCLGWGTWKRAWSLFENDSRKLLDKLERSGLAKEFDYKGNYPYTAMLRAQAEGRVDSWAIRWYASAFIENKLSLFPGKSLVYHNGNDGSGTNYTNNSILDVSLCEDPIPVCDIEVAESRGGRSAFESFFRKNFKRTFFQRVTSKIKKLFRY